MSFVIHSAEEARLGTSGAVKFSGFTTTTDRGIIVTDACDTGDGVVTFSVAIPFERLEEVEGEDRSWRVRGSYLLPGRAEGDVRFFSWRRAVSLTPDGLTRSAIAQLLAMVL